MGSHRKTNGLAKKALRFRVVLVFLLRHLAGLKGIKQQVARLRRLGSAPPPASTDAPPPPQPSSKKHPSASKPRLASAPYEAPSAYLAAAGTVLFGGLLFLAGAWPAALPFAFLLFAATALPWRVHRYTRVQPRNRMYLLDFCYAVAAATAAFLCLPQRLRHPGLQAAAYALADGPVAAALVAWQCAWVFHSPDHTVSVLLHLLPGLAMAARHHLAPQAAPTPSAVLGAKQGALWLLGAPLAFYLAWQLLYFAAVQLAGRQYIRRHNLDTSYRCLTRRARRTGNIWARLVLKGSTARRLAVYGAIQLAFTLATLLLFLPTYYCRSLAWAWQAAKVLVTVFYGCKHQCERGYKAAMAEGVRRYLLEQQEAVNAAAAALAADAADVE